jgi:hypothetical protein
VAADADVNQRRRDFRELLDECNKLRMLQKLDEMEARVEILEKRKKANDLLLALEAAEPPEEDRTLN